MDVSVVPRSNKKWETDRSIARSTLSTSSSAPTHVLGILDDPTRNGPATVPRPADLARRAIAVGRCEADQFRIAAARAR